MATHEPELFVVMGELALRSARDPAIAAIFRDSMDAWLSRPRTLVSHAQDEGFVDPGLDPNTVASLVIATLNGLFMVPVETTPSERIDKTLTQLERFLGLT